MKKTMKITNWEALAELLERSYIKNIKIISTGISYPNNKLKLEYIEVEYKE